MNDFIFQKMGKLWAYEYFVRASEFLYLKWGKNSWADFICMAWKQ